MTQRSRWALLLAALAFQPVYGASPELHSAMPLPAEPATMRILNLRGANLKSPTALWTSFPAWAVFESSTRDAEVQCRMFTPAGLGSGIGAVRVANPSGVSDWQLILLDNLPVVKQTGRNQTLSAAQHVQPPVGIDGSTTERRVDYYRLDLDPGTRLSVDVVAHRLGSALDPILRILDAQGRELIYCDDDPGAEADARVTYHFAEAGSYFIELRDARYQGGPRYHYQLRIGDFALDPIPFLETTREHEPQQESLPEQKESEPNETNSGATPIMVPATVSAGFAKPRDRDFYAFEIAKGARVVFAARTRSIGFPCDVFMQLIKPDGTVILESNGALPDEAAITNTFSEAGRYVLLVEELNRRGGPDLKYQLELRPYTAGFDLSVETDKLTAAPAGTLELKVNIARRDYNGPVAIQLQGLDGEFVISGDEVAEKANSATLKITVPEHVTPGELFHFRVLGEAKIGDDKVRSIASTMSALRKQFSLMLYPPRNLDGWIAFGVTQPDGSRISRQP